VGAYLGIDIGGTNIKAALVSDAGLVLAFQSRSWSGGRADDAVSVAAELGELVRDSQDVDAPVACGVGVAGLVDEARGIVRLSPNLPEWRDVELLRMISNAIGLRTRVENDANAAAYGEFKMGAARGSVNAIMLTLGTGVGGGIVLGGRLYRGSAFAGEVGHMTIKMDGRPCPCGNSGCLERYTNADAMVEQAVVLMDGGGRSQLETARAAGTLTAHDVGEAAGAGDVVALRAVAETGRALGVGLANLAVLFDPDLFVLGGGVAKAGRPLFDAARGEMVKRRYGSAVSTPRIVPAALEETAGAVGSALLARDEPPL
jgi:glucokinase